MRSKHGFYSQSFTLDIWNRKPRHPFMKVRDDLLTRSKPDNFIDKQFGQIAESNNVVYDRAIAWRTDAMVLPQKVFDNMQSLLFDDVRVKQDHARLTRHQPDSVMNIISSLAQVFSSLAVHIVVMITVFQFRQYALRYVRADHAVVASMMLHHRGSL